MPVSNDHNDHFRVQVKRTAVAVCGGGVRVISVSAVKELIRNKTRQTNTDTHLDPFWNHFGADTSRISDNFGFWKQIALVNTSNRFRNRS